MRIYLNTYSHSISTRDADTDDEWDRGDTHTSWTFGDAYVSDDKKYGEYIEVDFDVKRGDTVYLIGVIWSDGDSFGHDDCSRFELFAAYKDKDKALEAVKILEDTSTGSWDKKIKLPDGYELTYIPWNGYFESLDSVELFERVIT